MVDQIIRPANLPRRSSPVASEIVPVDNSVEVAGATIQEMVEAGRPTASQSEAEAGVNPSKSMSPLTTKQAIDFQVPAKIDAAIGALNLGTAAQRNADEFATAAQGDKADTAVQPARTIAAGTGLTGGGSLAADRTISLDIASQSDAEAGVMNDKGMTPLRTRQEIFALTETANPEAYGAKGDNVTDDADFWELAIASGKRIIARKGATYFVSRPPRGYINADIDLNGATIRCPAGGFDIRKVRTTYAVGAYFMTAEGSMQFTIPAGVVIAKGDLLLLESDTSSGAAVASYKHGQYAKVLSVASGVAYLTQPFYAAYQVDRIIVYEPLRIALQNGTIDVSGAVSVTSGFPPVGTFLIGEEVSLSNIVAIGGDHSGFGMSAQGLNVRVSNCFAYGVKNINGYPGGEGRWGYGISVNGDDVIVSGSGGADCKHVIASGARNFVTRSLKYIDCFGSSPKGQHAATVTPQGGSSQPLYQSLLDAHANVWDFEVVRPILDGVNALITVRGKRAWVVSPVLTSRGVVTQGKNDYLILQAERDVDYIRIYDPIVTIDPTGTPTQLTSLVGLTNAFDGNHGSVEVYRPQMNGGRIFNTQGNANVNLQKLIIEDARGTPQQAVRFGGSGTLAGKLDEFYMTGDLVQSAISGSNPVLVDIIGSELTSIEMHGTYDCRAVASGVAVRVGQSSVGMKLPSRKIDFSGVRLKTFHGAVDLSSNLADAPCGASFDGAEIQHYQGATAGVNSPGVSSVVPSAPTAPWTFRGARFSAGVNAGSGSENLRFVSANNLDLSGVTLDRQIARGNSFAIPLPVGARVIGANLILRLLGETNDIEVDEQGRLFRATAPTYTTLPIGTRVNIKEPLAGAPASYVFTTTGWKVETTLSA